MMFCEERGVRNHMFVSMCWGEMVGVVEAKSVHERQVLERIVIAGRSFRRRGSVGWGIGRVKSQLSILPVVIARKERVSIGSVKFGSSSLVLWRGGNEGGDQRRRAARRRE